MRAIVCEALGDARTPLQQGVLKLAPDWPAPKLLPGHVRIQVLAASLNFPDALQIKGEYQDKPKLPFVPGSEVSGILTEVADGVKGLKVGDKVCGLKQGGAFAEQCMVPAPAVWPVPAGVDVEAAAAIPIVYGTSDLALRHRAQLTAGQTVLILGAAGGVGVAALQLCKLLGARVIAAAAGPDKAAFLKEQGADVVIDTSALSKAEPLHKAVKAAAPKGVDVVYDPVGGPLLFEALKAVAWGAHYLVIGFASGDIPKVPANLLLVKNTTMHGVFWGSYMMHRPKVLLDSMRQVLAWFAEGKLHVEVSHRFPMERVTEAFEVVLSRKAKGKVLLLMGQPAARL